MSIENKLQLLWNSAKILNTNSQTHRLLKSYYINTCRRLVKNLQTPKEKFATSQMCPHCGCFWNDGEFGLKLVSKQFNNSSKTKKLIENFKQGDNSTGKVLTKSQRNRAKWLNKKISNQLAINCYQCKHRSLLKMENRKQKSQKQLLNEKSKSEIEAPTISLKNVTKKPKKQKNKDSKKVQGNNINTSMSTKSQKERNEKSVKISNKKNSKADTSTMVVSKTQKQNSLLQLAALLQKQSKHDTSNSAQKRLLSFLK